MFVCVYECMYASIAKISNSYKTANKGWVLNFKVSIEAIQHSASDFAIKSSTTSLYGDDK